MSWCRQTMIDDIFRIRGIARGGVGGRFFRAVGERSCPRTGAASLRGTTPADGQDQKRRALANLDEIVEAANGVMVARGDLGVETDLAEIPIVQKRIIAVANAWARPVITATQMLESMVEAPASHPSGSYRCGQRGDRRHGCGDAFCRDGYWPVSHRCRKDASSGAGRH